MCNYFYLSQIFGSFGWFVCSTLGKSEFFFFFFSFSKWKTFNLNATFTLAFFGMMVLFFGFFFF
jgi:hypothetical protein